MMTKLDHDRDLRLRADSRQTTFRLPIALGG
jgi:hypothetical protein